MALKIGIHTGPQDMGMAEFQKLWRRADGAGFHWISVWDHFYSNPMTGQQRNPCFEAVAAMAALAATTTRVRVGCLMFCVLFRNPGLLAKSAATIDHLSPRSSIEAQHSLALCREEYLPRPAPID